MSRPKRHVDSAHILQDVLGTDSSTEENLSIHPEHKFEHKQIEEHKRNDSPNEQLEDSLNPVINESEIPLEAVTAFSKENPEEINQKFLKILAGHPEQLTEGKRKLIKMAASLKKRTNYHFAFMAQKTTMEKVRTYCFLNDLKLKEFYEKAILSFIQEHQIDGDWNLFPLLKDPDNPIPVGNFINKDIALLLDIYSLLTYKNKNRIMQTAFVEYVKKVEKFFI